MSERRPLDILSAALAALACTLTLGWLQLGFEGLLDGDSYFHTRAAQQLREHGIESGFPQATFSTWSEHYSDKDLLFHAFLAPFCSDDATLLGGGKTAVIVLGALLFFGLAATMQGLGIRYGALWIFVFFSASPWLVEHLLAARPHLLALLLLEFEILCLLTARWKLLGLLCALHVLAHSSWILLPGLPLALALAEALRRERISWRAFAGVAVGLAAATVLHPYFPNNLSVGYDQLVEVARSVWSASPAIPHDLFGSELSGLAPWTFVAASPGWLPAAAGLALLAGTQPSRAIGTQTWALAAIAIGLLVLTLMTTRFFVFFALCASLLAGRVWTDLADAALRGRAKGSQRSVFGFATCFLLVCIFVGQWESNALRVRDEVAKLRIPIVYRPAIAHLDDVATPEDVVFHAFWRPFAWLYHFRPEGRYIEGLDPIFLHRYDEALFAKMLDVYRGRASDPYAIIHDDFGARWVFVARLDHTLAMRRLLKRTPFIRREYEDAYAEIYQVHARPERLDDTTDASPP